MSIFLDIVDYIAPFKEVRIKQVTQLCIITKILNLRRERHKALSKFKQTCLESWHNRHLHLYNQVQYMTKSAKPDYYETMVIENKNKPKKLWQTLKSLGTSSRSKSKPKIIGLEIDKDICFDKLKVSQKYNKIFTSIASSLVSKLNQWLGKFGYDHVMSFCHRQGVKRNAFHFKETSVDHVYTILNSLRASKAIDLDDL